MTTGTALQYLSDAIDIRTPNPALRKRPLASAEAEIRTLITERIRACRSVIPGRVGLMLSGGIDSIAVAVAAKEVGLDPLAVTITTQGDGGQEERDRAREVAERLGFDHVSVDLTHSDLEALSIRAMTMIGISEIWEVAAAIPVLAGMDVFRHAEVRGPILTGSGADAIFAGGRKLSHPVGSEGALSEVDDIIRAESHKNFQRHRLIPDFYSRLLGSDEGRWVHVFQTEDFWRFSETLPPEALFGEEFGLQFDKYFLRRAAESSALLDRSMIWTEKSPIQRSSGIFSSLARLSRLQASKLPGAGTYSDPDAESFQDICIRLYLESLRTLALTENERSNYDMYLRHPEGLSDRLCR